MCTIYQYLAGLHCYLTLFANAVTRTPAQTSALELERPEHGGMLPVTAICMGTGEKFVWASNSVTALTPQRK